MASIVVCRPCRGVGTIRKSKTKCPTCDGAGKVLVEVVGGRVVVVGPVVVGGAR